MTTTQPARLTARFSEALAYTADLHRHQRRKGGEIPYVGHLLSVAGLVIEGDGTETQARNVRSHGVPAWGTPVGAQRHTGRRADHHRSLWGYHRAGC